MTRVAHRCFLLSTLLLAAQLDAQTPHRIAASESGAVPRRVEMDFLAGAFVPEGRSSEPFLDIAERGHVGGVVATRLRVGLGATRSWALLFSATMARTGTLFEHAPRPVSPGVREPRREYAVGFGDVGLGLERRWRLGTRTALLTSVEATIGRYRNIAGDCEAGPGDLSCTDASPRFDAVSWGPTLVPTIGLSHAMSDRSALVVAWRPAFLKLTERTPQMFVAGVRVAPGGTR